MRAWPGHWSYDTYDISPYLKPGENTIAVLVNHYGEGTVPGTSPAPPGLLAQIELEGCIIGTDDAWLAAPDAALSSLAPRICVQEGFEEQFDARLDDDWGRPSFDDSSWQPATAIRPAEDGHHRNMAPRDIPHLTAEPVLPRRVIEAIAVSSTS